MIVTMEMREYEELKRRELEVSELRIWKAMAEEELMHAGLSFGHHQNPKLQRRDGYPDDVAAGVKVR